MSNVASFLTHVAVSSKAQAAFEADPNKALHGSGLSAASKAAILSKDPGKIRDAILAEKGLMPGGAAAAGDTEVVIVVVL